MKTYLAQNGIETKVHYTKTLDGKNVGQYPNAETMCAKALSLPIYPHLNMDEIILIALTAAATFSILDTFIPVMGDSARSGAGLGIGANLVGFPGGL